MPKLISQINLEEGIIPLQNGMEVNPRIIGIDPDKMRSRTPCDGTEMMRDILERCVLKKSKQFFCEQENKDEISYTADECHELIQECQNDPFLFPKRFLHINTDVWKNDLPPDGWKPKDRIYPLWSKQREILEALFKYKRVAVKSGIGTGKTFDAAVAALTIFYVMEAQVITTSSVFSQLKRQLWGEIHRIYGRAESINTELGQALGGQLNLLSLEMGGKWFMTGISAATHKAGTFHGYHGEKSIFLLMDEAGLIERPIFDAIEGILSAEDSYALYIGQPIDPLSGFADVFKSSKVHPIGKSYYNKDTGFYCMTINCFEAPNVKHNRTIYPGMSSLEWVTRKRKVWGEDSMLYKSRIIAEFPEDTQDCLFPLRIVEAGLARYPEWEQYLPQLKLKVISCDVARKGRNRTVIGLLYEGYISSKKEDKEAQEDEEDGGEQKWREKELEEEQKFFFDKDKEEDFEDDDEPKQVIQMFKIVRTYTGKLTTYTAGTLKILYDDLKDEGTMIHVDDTGVGGGVSDTLEEDEYPVVPVVVGSKPTSSAEEDIFENQGMQFYWRVAKALENGTLAINDDELASELTKIKYEPSRKGIKIIQKSKIQLEKLTESGKQDSPDKADCLMLAYADSTSSGIRFM